MTTTFLQSEVQDPFQLYEEILSDNPVYWDDKNQLWAIYSYVDCKAILDNPSAYIPIANSNNDVGLNKSAYLIYGQLARLSNGLGHEIARETALFLFGKMKTIPISVILENLLQSNNDKGAMDWVDSVCKKLPNKVVLESFGFNAGDAEYISNHMGQLVKIMLPNKTPEQVLIVNEISEKIYGITEKHLIQTGIFEQEMKALSEKYQIDRGTIFSFAVSNLIGLFIQSYDAGRGVLSNSLLQILNQNNRVGAGLLDKKQIEAAVVETLRFDPPIHNTRRVATEDILLNDNLIKKGQSMFVVLAAANRDPEKFDNANVFNVDRPNNSQHLAFGSGGHECLAKYFSIHLAVETLSYFFGKFSNSKLIDVNIKYEPMINARLPKEILISLS